MGVMDCLRRIWGSLVFIAEKFFTIFEMAYGAFEDFGQY